MPQKFRVLVIDDEPFVADALQLILTAGGYDVDVAASGCDGLVRLTRQHFDLIITDLVLPDLSGLDVIKQIREQSPRSHVILITAHGSQELATSAIESGASDVLFKPFPPTVISESVRRTLARDAR